MGLSQINKAIKKSLAILLPQRKFKKRISAIFDFHPKEKSLKFSPLNVGDIQDKIQRKTCFYYNKINHGFWDHLVFVQQAIHENPDYSADDFYSQFHNDLYQGNFLESLLALLKLNQGDNYYYAASCQAFSGSDRLVLMPRFSTEQPLIELINYYRPKNLPIYNGTMWKDAVLDNSFLNFMRSLSNQHVVIIGPEPLSYIGKLFQFKTFQHIAIHPEKARQSRDEILKNIFDTHKSFQGEYAVFLFQAATLATYLIGKISGVLKSAAFIDVGMSLDIFAPKKIMTMPFGKIFFKKLKALYADFLPGWVEVNSPSQVMLEKIKKEKKSAAFDLGFVQSYLRLILGLPENREIIFLGDQLKEKRWLVCALSKTSELNLENVQQIDCSSSGLICFNQVKSISQDDYEGVIFSNPLGVDMKIEINRLQDFCRQHHKQLVFDAGTCLSQLALVSSHADMSLGIDSLINVLDQHIVIPSVCPSTCLIKSGSDTHVSPCEYIKYLNNYLDDNFLRFVQRARVQWFLRYKKGKILSREISEADLAPEKNAVYFSEEVKHNFSSCSTNQLLTRLPLVDKKKLPNAYRFHAHIVLFNAQREASDISNQEILSCLFDHKDIGEL